MDALAETGVAIVGAGRLGSALVRALADAGVAVSGPHLRGYTGRGSSAGVVLLCVPDRAVREAAALIDPTLLVGHTAGALGLDIIGRPEAFSVHPLLTVTPQRTAFAGAAAAVAGTNNRTLAIASAIATRVGMRPIEVDESLRPLYHAAASAASNYLVTVEGLAERLAARAGIERSDLAPLVRAAVENWIAGGAAAALTGPVARGDNETVNRQRAAVAEHDPSALPLWDALTDATRVLAQRTR